MSEWFVVIEIAEMHTITWVSLLYGKSGREQKVRCRDSDDTDKEKEHANFIGKKRGFTNWDLPACSQVASFIMPGLSFSLMTFSYCSPRRVQ